MQEGQEHHRVVFVPDNQPAEAMQPRERAFHNPASPVTTKRATVLRLTTGARRPMRCNQLRASLGQSAAERITVVPLVGNQSWKTRPRHANILEDSLQKPGLSGRGAVDVQSQRRALAVGHQHHLRAFAPARRANLIAPPFAEAKVASTKHSVNFRRFRRSSRRNSFRQIPSQTPNCSYSASRRQQVAGLGYSGGRSFHRAPVLSTHRIPSNVARSSFQGRPPFGPPCSFGNNGAILRHCRSVNTGSVRGMRPPS
jgi:hypothetical protein